MNFYASFCKDSTIFGVGIAGIVVGFLLLVLVLAVIITFLLVDIRHRKKKKLAEVQEADRMKKLCAEGLDRILIYLAFMGQKGLYKMPKNRFPVDRRKQILTEPAWDDNRRQALMEIAKFYDNAATEKTLDDPNSPYYPLSRRVPKGEGGGSEESKSMRGNTSGAMKGNTSGTVSKRCGSQSVSAKHR